MSGVIRASFPSRVGRRLSVRRPRTAGRLFAPGLLLALALPPEAGAQRPGDLVGRVTEQGTGMPVQAALVELIEAGRQVMTDPAGGYGFRALEPGTYTLRVTRLGYAAYAGETRVQNGRVARADVALRAVPIPLEPLRVTGLATGGRTGSTVAVTRAEIEQSGARTAGDVVARVPGVVVRRTSPGGAETVSIRGSSADAVLVLLDGVPLNDPITGEADVSAVAARQVETVIVQPGAGSARYGPRAEAGVVWIETRPGGLQPQGTLTAGSLGSWSGAAESGGAWPLAWGAGGQARWLDGAFAFDQPREIGGGRDRRQNADLRQRGLFATTTLPLARGELRLRGEYEGLERGLPGKGFAPSVAARQQLDRLRGFAAWKRMGPASNVDLAIAAVRQTVRSHDRAPSLGLPYDDTTVVESLELRSDVARGGTAVPGRALGLGAELRWQRIRTSVLRADAPRERLDAGFFGHAAVGWRVREADLSLGAQVRADHDDTAEGWYASHALTGTLTQGSTTFHMSHRSAYSPPSLGDQFFRDAVGVEPNPDLRAERIPSELEVGVVVERGLGEVDASLSLAAYRGDVRGMIVWEPDYRFVWSPRNADVRRRGFEAGLELDVAAADLRGGIWYANARVTYDRGPDGRAAQVVYRPRHTAVFEAGWSPGPWRADIEARLTGERSTVPSGVNTLPSFWTLALGLGRTWRVGGVTADLALRVDRLLDEKANLIFGFPEPGRVFEVQLRVRPGRVAAPTSVGANQPDTSK